MMKPKTPKPKVHRETCPSFHRGHLPPQEQLDKLQSLTAPHVDSFNFFLKEGLRRSIPDVDPVDIDLLPHTIEIPNTPSTNTQPDSLDILQIWVENPRITTPLKNSTSQSGTSTALTPRECRESNQIYGGALTADICFRIVNKQRESPESSKYEISTVGQTSRIHQKLGDMPIMVLSNLCHLYRKSPAELIRLKEEANEIGGYFIVNGIERCIRLLQIPRRNHAMAIDRPSYSKRGPLFSSYGVSMRSSHFNGDQSSITLTLHFLTSGGMMIRFTARKQEFLIPVLVIVRCLREVSDEEIYERIVTAGPEVEGGDEHAIFLKSRAMLLLRDGDNAGLYSREACLSYLGSRFRMICGMSSTVSDVEVGEHIIKKYILIHLERWEDKQECFFQMMRKLYIFADGKCGPDNSDSFSNHEILLPGHLFCTMVKEKFEELLQSFRMQLNKDKRKDFTKFLVNCQSIPYRTKMTTRVCNSFNLGKKIAAFLSTGNVVSSSGLDLMQVSGFTIVAERLNFIRFFAHFRSIHRGQFFMEMKTTAVRKLLPDQWGFLCPVHTPDGGPCGLLGHLAIRCKVITELEPNIAGLENTLVEMGVRPSGVGNATTGAAITSANSALCVWVDGKVLGTASAATCQAIATRLRYEKVDPDSSIPSTLEVAHIPPTGNPSAPFPGLYLHTSPARCLRPTLHLPTGKTELIGPMAQPFMDIACLPSDIIPNVTTHQELDPANMLSLVASLTPFSDQNQSPRNMYQCQMGKQTMGTPAYSILPHRTDNKMYKLQNPQAPLVQTKLQREFSMDEHPNGTNAVVAVLSYTGFDMEDAMILNKGSYERGFGHATVYKTMKVDLAEETRSGTSKSGGSAMAQGGRYSFGNLKPKFTRRGEETQKKGEEEEMQVCHPSLGLDGLPEIGTWVSENDPLYCIVDSLTKKDKPKKYKDIEKACVQSVRLVGNPVSPGPLDKCSITLRIPRNPVIGDKFSSRHGQKGVLSILWPSENMPFSESGISPDIIINPHAFPSRMTIGMLVESMAGKAGAMHGFYQDATPFSFHETGSKLAVDHFGEQLQSAGYNYYGSEPLYSGVSGCVMHADLYIGVVYYQRLRHMVSDKHQVRATGPVSPLTRQPVKGRKRGGGIRLGEMERDALLSHGAAFLLQDRLMNSSDRHVAYACSRCGDFLSPSTERSKILSAGQSTGDAVNRARLRVFCRNPKCLEAVGNKGEGDDMAVEPIALPYVYRYLCNELAGMNIKMTLEIE